MMHNGRILDEAGVYGGQAIPQVPAATASSYSSGSVVTHESSRPKFSYGVQLDAVDPSASLDLQHHAPASSSISASRHGHTTNTNTPTSATTASPVINSSNSNVSGNDIESQQSDWLAEAQRTLSQDLETSKKELEIIRYIIEEMRTREQNRNQNQNQNRIQGQQEKQSEATLENSRNDNTVQREEDMRTGREDSRMRLMSACREYTRSRCHLLRDRLRQVQFWTHARRLGNYVPGKAPEDVSFICSHT